MGLWSLVQPISINEFKENMKKKICMYRYSSLALAPDEIVKSINKYSDKYTSVLFIGREDKDVIGWDRVLEDLNVPVIYSNDISKERFSKENFDLIHFHNRTVDVDEPSITQFHSPEGTPMNLDFSGTKLVIAQYHANLKIYRGFNVVRNIIDYNDPMYTTNYDIKKIKIGYSPSVKIKTSANKECKGYIETKEILEKLTKDYDVDIDIITDVCLVECIRRKSKCNILIDECVTESYHRCSLEGMSLGKMTICSISNEVMDVIKSKTGGVDMPVENVGIHNLEDFLIDIIENKGLEYVVEKGKTNRNWMETYWNPKDIIEQDFEPIYDKELKKLGVEK